MCLLQTSSFPFTVTGVTSCEDLVAALDAYVESGAFVADANAEGIPLTGATLSSLTCTGAGGYARLPLWCRVLNTCSLSWMGIEMIGGLGPCRYSKHLQRSCTGTWSSRSPCCIALSLMHKPGAEFNGMLWKSGVNPSQFVSCNDYHFLVSFTANYLRQQPEFFFALAAVQD